MDYHSDEFTLTTFDINYCIYAFLNGTVLNSAGYDYDETLLVPLPEELIPITRIVDGQESTMGVYSDTAYVLILVLCDTPSNIYVVMFVARQITRSDGSGPPNGYIIHLRYLNHTMSAWAQLTFSCINMFASFYLLTSSVEDFLYLMKPCQTS